MDRFGKYNKKLIKASNKSKQIQRIGTNNQLHTSIYGEYSIPSTSGYIYTATIEIISVPKSTDLKLAIGIDESTENKKINDCFVGQKSTTNYSYSNNGFIQSNNTINRPYAQNAFMKNNDIIKMQLNLTDKTLTYYKNNIFTGIAFNNIKTAKNLHYSLAIYLSCNCSVKLLSTKQQIRLPRKQLLKLLISGYCKHISKKIIIPNDIQSIIISFCGESFASKNKAKNNEIYEWKIVVLGGGGVGKSALVIRLVTDNFLESYDPIIEDSYRKSVEIDGRACLLDILDSAGQEEFSTMQEQWMKEGEAFMFVYSITSRSTFDEVNMLRDKLLRDRENYDGNYSVILVGNKCDKDDQRQVSTQEGQELAREWGVGFYETSAMCKINHEECFYELIRELRKQHLEGLWLNEFDLKSTKKRNCILQ